MTKKKPFRFKAVFTLQRQTYLLHTYIHTYSYIHTYTYIHIHSHTYIHTYIHTLVYIYPHLSYLHLLKESLWINLSATKDAHGCVTGWDGRNMFQTWQIGNTYITVIYIPALSKRIFHVGGDVHVGRWSCHRELQRGGVQWGWKGSQRLPCWTTPHGRVRARLRGRVSNVIVSHRGLFR